MTRHNNNDDDKSSMTTRDMTIYTMNVVHDTSKRCIVRRASNTVQPFAQNYRASKLKRIQRILKARMSDPVRRTNLNSQGQAWKYFQLKSGGQKKKWANEAMRLYWEEYQDQLPQEYRETDFNPNDLAHAQILQQLADSRED